MKTLTFLCLTSLLLVGTLHSSQESPELQQAATLTDSVIKLFSQRKYNEALPLAKRALQIREKLLPRTDQRVTDSLTNLGEIYIGKQDYEAARDVFKRSLEIQRERFGPESVNLAPLLDRLAPLHFRTGSYREAEDAYKRALALREKALGSKHEQVARSLFNIAEYYRVRREFQYALENYQRALMLYQQLSAMETPEYQRVREGLSCLSYAKPELVPDMQEVWKEFDVPGPERLPLPGQILNGIALSLPRPEYPEAARVRRLAGMVVVLVLIDEQGKVINARDMCQGPVYLSEASVAAALKARFSPTKLSGMPVKVYGVIQYNFVPR
jgi:TonB family protein